MDNNPFDALLRAKVSASTTDGVKSSDIPVDRTRDLWFRLFVPLSTNNESSLPIVIYFHGGGFAVGSPDTALFDAFTRSLVKELPAVVVSVNYRLTPDHRFPTQYEDGLEVIKFIDNRIGNGDGWLLPPEADIRRWFLAGDSAGGNIAHHVAVRCAGAGFRVVRIKGILSYQPFFGGQERTESELRLMSTPTLTVAMSDWLWEAFLPEGSDRDHPAVNVFGPRGREDELSGVEYPATLLVVGGMDPLQDWQRRFGAGLVRSSKEVRLVEYPNAMHGFYLMGPELPECGMFMNEARNFIRQRS
ncbi:hypothetical protein Droror1_Dr00016918 [Drosera rotundifolia]